jgi:hypothetical protein
MALLQPATRRTLVPAWSLEEKGLCRSPVASRSNSRGWPSGMAEWTGRTHWRPIRWTACVRITVPKDNMHYVPLSMRLTACHGQPMDL